VYSIRSWPDSSARKSANCSMKKAWNKTAARENSSMDSSSILPHRAKGAAAHPSHCRGAGKSGEFGPAMQVQLRWTPFS
jgi:hypothetical protein